MQYVQFTSSEEEVVTSVFGSPQDPVEHPHQGVVEDSDTRYLKFITADVDTLERAWRDIELLRADYELNKVQDADPNAVGTVALWREYRKNLRAFPQREGFPDVSARPVAPDMKME